jgi:V8-like Glu-specific endopeptidase
VLKDLNKSLRQIADHDRKLAQVLRRMVQIEAADRYPDLRRVLKALDPEKTERKQKTRADTRPPGGNSSETSQPSGPPQDRNEEEAATPFDDSGPVVSKSVRSEFVSIIPPPERPPPTIPDSEVDALVDLLVRKAVTDPHGAESFFRRVVEGANLPWRFRESLTKIGRDHPRNDARTLVQWAINQGSNQKDPHYTTLGSLLHAVLPELGFEDSAYVVALVSCYRLYLDEELLSKLEMAYQVPRLLTPPVGQSSGVGPDFDWHGPEETLELQGLFARAPDLLDVGFLKRAIERAASVCRLEVNGTARGTGFLVGRDLLLTNYHVLDYPAGVVLKESARAAVLRFGCYTDRDGRETEGQTFVLAPEPIEKESPTSGLDYLLLRVAREISQAQNIRPVPISEQALKRQPSRKDGLHILQHPEGQSMKIALCSNGVSHLDPVRGIIQYVTQTRGGASGAPCFNDEWQLVGLHHAERAKSFGSIREGIWFRAIYDEIKAFLPRNV